MSCFSQTWYIYGLVTVNTKILQLTDHKYNFYMNIFKRIWKKIIQCFTKHIIFKTKKKLCQQYVDKMQYDNSYHYGLFTFCKQYITMKLSE